MKAETDVCVFFTKFIPPLLRTFVSFSTRQSILIRRRLKHHCLVCLAHFSVLAIIYNCLCFIFTTPRLRYLKFCFIVNLSFFFELCERTAFFSYKLISTVTVRHRARRKTFCKPVCHVHFQKKNNKRKNKYVIHRLRSVRLGKNCTRGLEYGPRPQAEGTVFLYTDRPKPVNNVFIS